jgi:hypothetical protein
MYTVKYLQGVKREEHRRVQEGGVQKERPVLDDAPSPHRVGILITLITDGQHEQRAEKGGHDEQQPDRRTHEDDLKNRQHCLHHHITRKRAFGDEPPPDHVVVVVVFVECLGT